MTLTKETSAREVDLASGHHLRYYEAGDPAAPTVVLLHGSGPGATGWSNFSGNIGPIAEAGFHVLAPDMPGWGDSSAVATRDMDHDADLVGFLDALGIDKAALVGNSMGAHTAVRFTTLHPERVTHLVTMGASLGRGPASLFVPGGGPSEGLKVLVQAYRDPSPENMRALVEIMTYDNARFATPELAAARSEAALARPDHLQNYVEGLAHGAPIPIKVDRSLLPSITAPTLLIHGRDDRVLHFEVSLNLLANIPDSRLVLLNRCGHWAMIEHAEEFNRLVVDFLAHAGDRA
ncbi:alpha/beta fold hydrolase [Nocardioides sp. zg-536]|uniref:Alpha/beta fold hydrolase n=1 Tax=Nocardioides faecalis TaxID=2803858 RepID=A0A938Y3T6_9ACTN|nr:alpha/beta hydrolase [Nocardioides faecalis]MBM9458647.1 alpha/beta fold hydrolase [Nocardioides faecalis]MBS4752979.1 alpha/beta fold hydrolase [Nocardioides faecalis]QVI58642.1 alpha/beta fold hydrolase [Nocardioides faecalis]